MDEQDVASVTLLYVDSDARSRERFATTLTAYDAITVRTASTVADAIEILESLESAKKGSSTSTGTATADAVTTDTDTDTATPATETELGTDTGAATDADVDCIVSAYALADGTGLELLAAVRDRDRNLPFVLYPDDEHGSERLASESIAAGATSYLPRSFGDGYETLLGRVADGVERYERERERDLELDMFETLMNDVPISIYFKDRDARHIRASKEVGPTMSIDPIGKTDPELYGEEIGLHAQRAYEDDMRVIETGEPIFDKEEAWAIEVDAAETIWLRSTKIPWRGDDGTIRGLVGVTRDVTELKRREAELEQQKQRLDRFASFASHDLRTPLNVAQGYLEIAEETGDPTALEKVANALEKMDRLIDDLLTTAQSDVGLASVESVPFERLVEDTWSETRTGTATLRTAIPEGAVINADEGLLGQLLENLFRNAVEHGTTTSSPPNVPEDAVEGGSTNDQSGSYLETADGAVETRFEESTEEDPESLEIVVGTTETGFFVEDDGPGIPLEERESVFEYGYTGADGGTGVGLAIVSQIVDAHGWEVSVSEGRAGGARFDVENCLLVTEPTARSVAAGAFGRSPDRIELHDAYGQVDVGNATPAGEASYDARDGVWSVAGGGRNLWHRIDECHFVHTRVDGDVRIVGRITDLETVNEYSKAGVMLRAEPEAGSPFGYVGLVPQPETELLWRPGRDDVITSRQLTEEPTVPHWYRLDRIDDTVRCYHSDDGQEWHPIDQRTVELGETSSVGLAVCSHDPEHTCTALFEDVSIVPL